MGKPKKAKHTYVVLGLIVEIPSGDPSDWLTEWHKIDLPKNDGGAMRFSWITAKGDVELAAEDIHSTMETLADNFYQFMAKEEQGK